MTSIVAGLLLIRGLAAAAPPSRPQPTYELFAELHARLMNGESAARLEDVLPRLTRNLRIADEVSREHWSESTPFDELAKDYVLPERVAEALGIRQATTDGVVHAPAGTMHTYGYLFSQLRTAYGLKSRRWIESRLDERLGLAAGTFGPFAPQGEFASNVTSALLELIGRPARLAHAARLKPRAKRLGSVEQRVTWRRGEGSLVEAVIRTHLVELGPLKDLVTSDTHLLIYEIRRGGRHRLVTAFPVDREFAGSIMAAAPAADAAFKPRFNLYIDPTWTVVEHRSDGFRPAAR